jgi:hypothetical protein
VKHCDGYSDKNTADKTQLKSSHFRPPPFRIPFSLLDFAPPLRPLSDAVMAPVTFQVDPWRTRETRCRKPEWSGLTSQSTTELASPLKDTYGPVSFDLIRLVRMYVTRLMSSSSLNFPVTGKDDGCPNPLLAS